MFRQHQEDTGTTEPVEDYQNNIQAPTKVYSRYTPPKSRCEATVC